MPAKLLDEIIYIRKQSIIRFLDQNPGAKKKDIAAHLNVTERTIMKTLGPMKATGEIFVTGSNHGIKYWSKPQDERYVEVAKREWTVSNDAIDGRLIFLNRYRPAGENLIFQRCKENCQQLLSILQVMAGRRNVAQ